MNKTCVLFVSHLVGDEIKYRYQLLKNAAAELGYDTYFCGDLDHVQSDALPVDTGFYGISYDKFKSMFPHMVYDIRKNVYQNCLPMVVFPFWQDHDSKYSRFWIVEFDVCCYGNWIDFFKQYECNDADLITSKPLFKSYDEDPKWWAYKDVDKSILSELVKEKCVYQGLMCCSRLSEKALKDIDEFYKTYNNNKRMFFEMAWPTCISKKNGRIVTFDSNYFIYRPEMPVAFNDFEVATTLYHPVKTNIMWQKKNNFVN